MYDIVIIGAGPAGLTAAKTLVTSKRDLKLLILEQGVDFSKRNHSDETTVASGFGGAGLFTDGKISLPPSASYIWSELDRDYVKISYNSVRSWLQGYEIDLPKFDYKWFNNSIKKYEGQKNYHSEKLTFEKSESIIKDCEILLRGFVHLDTQVKNITKIKFENHDAYQIETDGGIFQTLNIVVATGKIGMNPLFSELTFNQNYLAEVGVRIEVPNNCFIPYNTQQLDYKIIKQEGDYEIRTFCCCKDGSVVRSKIGDYYTFNGMISEGLTGRSNIGIVIRGKQGGTADKLLSTIQSKQITYGEIALPLYLNGVESIYGELDKIFIRTIKGLVCTDKITESDGIIYYPAVERLGACCDDFVPSSLRLKDENIWVCGDASYKFRGLLAAFISGEIVAREILDTCFSKIFIKKSSVESTKVIFTAQSKEYFYCKDVICEYVLKEHNAIPINPFQVFNYFLNDRVSRDLIRKGNNNLIMRCDELWVFGKISDGVLFEIKLAKDHGKPIRYFTIGTYARDISEINIEQVKFDSELHANQTTRKNLIKFLQRETVDEQDPIVKQLDLFGYID